MSVQHAVTDISNDLHSLVSFINYFKCTYVAVPTPERTVRYAVNAADGRLIFTAVENLDNPGVIERFENAAGYVMDDMTHDMVRAMLISHLPEVTAEGLYTMMKTPEFGANQFRFVERGNWVVLTGAGRDTSTGMITFMDIAGDEYTKRPDQKVLYGWKKW